MPLGSGSMSSGSLSGCEPGPMARTGMGMGFIDLLRERCSVARWPGRRKRPRRVGRLDLQQPHDLETVVVPVADAFDRADVLAVAQHNERWPAPDAVTGRDR